MNSKYLASIIFNIRIVDDFRKENLFFNLRLLLQKYGDLFEIIILEQDVIPLCKEEIMEYFGRFNNLKYYFVYNPREFNAGWGKNVAARHFAESKVLVFYDADIIVGENFLDEIYLCHHHKYKVVSPHKFACFLGKDDSECIKKDLNFIKNIELKSSYPVTITGGICIFDKNFFLDLNGFEQYISYGAEDRAMDVTIEKMLKNDEIKIAEFTYAHLWHPSQKRFQSDLIYSHLKDNYGCEYFKELQTRDYIHLKCRHVNKAKIIQNINLKKDSFGDIELYKSGINLTINGLKIQQEQKDEFCSNDSEYGNSVFQFSFNDIYKINNFRNIFKRKKRCFIIGNGPSLNKHDLSLLKNEITFGFNSIFYKKDEFKPNFYIVEDDLVMKERLKEIENYEVQYKFFPINYKELLKPAKNQIFFKMNLGFYQKTSRYFRIPRFSLDATEELFCGQSVTYIALQLAYFMGFEEVYLIGMDFHYIIPESHKRVGSTLVSDTDDPNHFHKDYFGKGKSWHDPKLHEVAKNYKMAKLIYESSGRKIYNATIGGKLEIFDRVDYYSIFKKSNIPNTGAVEQVKKHLSYKLGKAIIHDTKQFKNIINFPFRIFRIVKEHNKDKNNIGKNLREYSDYSEAVKIQQYFSYRLGKCIVSNYKNPFLLYKLIKIVIEYKRRK